MKCRCGGSMPLAVASLVVFLSASATAAAAQQGMERINGFPVPAAAAQLAYEAELRSVVDTARARRLSQLFSAEPHVAGTPRQRETAFLVDSLMRSFGLETAVDSYLVYLPLPTRLEVHRVTPTPLALDVSEPPLAEDPTTQRPMFPQFNAYTGRGDVTGEVVYVNYGLIEDYELLAEAGVAVAGKIAIARYGRSYRGIKAREAERHGAIGLLMYSDPEDDGYARGDVYPEGPFRPERGVQRGSIKNDNGDPSTPAGPSTFDAPRVPEAQMTGIARIPVAPISYGAAAELLRDVRGADIPDQAWQGGLPFRYHAGPGPVTARVVTETERGDAAYHTIYNTVAVLPGAVFPDEMVVIGAHRDAWGPGAIDNVSGTVSVLEAARAFAAAAERGNRPARSLMFATWDAEEWGLIGSTEFVERGGDGLRREVVAYLNQDSPASGPRFGAGASAPLKTVIREVARSMPDPFGDGSVYQAWAAAQNLADSEQTRLGDLGGGSDFGGFYNHLGIASASYGFGGTGGGVYHSAYDTYRWMNTFGDPDFVAHAAAAGFSASLAARLANAPLLPLDNAELAAQLADLVADLPIDSIPELSDAVTALSAAVDTFRIVADHAAELTGIALAEHPNANRTDLNLLLRRVEQAFTRPEGLRGRSWFRHLLFAADRDNGYGNMPLPSINEPLRDGDTGTAEAEIADLTERVGDATEILREIAAFLSM